MAETKALPHTPGPWEIIDRPGSLPEYDGLVIANRERKEIVAEFHLGESFGSRAERHHLRRANARLMAAAPDLLAACIAVDEHLSRTFPPYPPGESPYDKVRAAIAKASR